MNWVLIIVTWSSAITSANFDTEASCAAAKQQLTKIPVVRYMECLKK